MDAAGKLFHQIAHKYGHLNPETLEISSLNNGHQLSITSVSIAKPTNQVLAQSNTILSADANLPVYIYSTSKDASIVKWDFFTGKKAHIINGGLKTTKKTKTIVGKKLLEKQSLTQHSDHVYTSACSSDGKFLVTGGKDKVIHIWSVIENAHVGSFKHHRDAVSGLAFKMGGGNHLYSCSFDRSVKVWNVDEMSYIETL